jgi:ribosomal protein L9
MRTPSDIRIRLKIKRKLETGNQNYGFVTSYKLADRRQAKKWHQDKADIRPHLSYSRKTVTEAVQIKRNIKLSFL